MKFVSFTQAKNAFVVCALLVTIGNPLPVLALDIPDNAGPEIIRLKMGTNVLTFQHLKHQKTSNNECFHCHKAQEWKIKPWDREVAHQVCISCHDLNDKGPVECKGCHVSK
jgi:hypothetical protein